MPAVRNRDLHGRHPNRYPHQHPPSPTTRTPGTRQVRGTRSIPQTRKVYVRGTRNRVPGTGNRKGESTHGPHQGSRCRRMATPKELQGWMGFINFYRRFIEGFSEIARVLNELTKKGVPWEWTNEREEAFQKLKKLICTEPVLLMPKLEEPFELEVDASNYAIGATLNQKDERGRWHPVAYYSTTLSETERNYDIYDKELLAVVKSLRHWRTYLAGAPHQIVIHTDHSNLLYWKEPRKISRRIAREFQELQEYNFVLKHVAGNKNAR